MNILLFGGTFDPPHAAHTKMVQTILERQLFDEVWYVPVGQHDQLFLKPGMGSTADRLKMLSLIQDPGTKIETFEVDSGKPSHTHTTLRAMAQLHPDKNFSWLMGSDQLAKLDLWSCDSEQQCFPHCADEFDYYIYPRLSYPLDLPYPNLKVIQGVEPMAIAATDIRVKVKAGEPITGLVDPQVEAYIKEKGLYLNSQ